MTVTAIVAARGGSVRLPGKALLPFAGTTLIGHKVRTLAACRLVDRIVVNSDSPEIVTEAMSHGAEPIDGADYADDTRRMLYDSARQVGGDIILWAHPTNPLVRAETYDAAIEQFARDRDVFDSLLSVYEVRRHAWVDGQPCNYNPWRGGHPLAKQLPPIHFQDGAVFIQPREAMLRNQYFFGLRPGLFVMPTDEVCDVDEREDVEYARSCLASRPEPVPA